jgi:ribosome-binding factor A
LGFSISPAPADRSIYAYKLRVALIGVPDKIRERDDIMIQQSSSNDGIRSLCAETGDDDGQHAILDSRNKSRTRRAKWRTSRPESGLADRKVHQLCRQVAQTLDEVLAECGDRVLQCLRVEAVQPFPDASRLLATVAFIDNRPGTIADIALVLDHLHRASGHLRCEIATAVTRKRAPLLLYRLAEPQGS